MHVSSHRPLISIVLRRRRNNMKFRKNLSLMMLMCCILSTAYCKDEESFETVRKSAKIAGYSLSKTQ
jgi:hypothetical protein